MLQSQTVTFSTGGDQKTPLESAVPWFPWGKSRRVRAQLRQSGPKGVRRSLINAYEQPSLFRGLICKADVPTCDHYVY